jgi:hypothetical protein
MSRYRLDFTPEAAALREVRRRKGFYIHLLPYALVVTGLTVLNVLLTPHYPWVLWVAAGWGIGLTIHGLVAFRGGIFGRRWESQQVRKLVARKN